MSEQTYTRIFGKRWKGEITTIFRGAKDRLLFRLRRFHKIEEIEEIKEKEDDSD